MKLARQVFHYPFILNSCEGEKQTKGESGTGRTQIERGGKTRGREKRAGEVEEQERGMQKRKRKGQGWGRGGEEVNSGR